MGAPLGDALDPADHVRYLRALDLQQGVQERRQPRRRLRSGLILARVNRLVTSVSSMVSRPPWH